MKKSIKKMSYTYININKKKNIAMYSIGYKNIYITIALIIIYIHFISNIKRNNT